MMDQRAAENGPCLRCVVGGIAGLLVALWMTSIAFRGARRLGRRLTRPADEPARQDLLD